MSKFNSTNNRFDKFFFHSIDTIIFFRDVSFFIKLVRLSGKKPFVYLREDQLKELVLLLLLCGTFAAKYLHFVGTANFIFLYNQMIVLFVHYSDEVTSADCCDLQLLSPLSLSHLMWLLCKSPLTHAYHVEIRRLLNRLAQLILLW